MKPDPEILKAIAVCAELTGTTFSEPAVRVFAADLAAFERGAVLAALERCRRELRGRLTVADVITRISDSDGRPGVEEAWAMLPKHEADSEVITQEMAVAFGAARPLLDAGDVIAARMAFKEVYERQVQQARVNREPVRWFPSLGHDVEARGPVLRRAVELGRLTRQRAVELLPSIDLAPPDPSGGARLAQIRAQVVAQLEAPTKELASEHEQV